jgi:NhaP-type Na+/H+ or K+/H+ antiporter
MDHVTLISIALIGLFAFSSQWLAWWIKIPAILFLLLFGILLGPVLNVIHPQQLFGTLLDPMIKIAVAIILFEGSLTLNFKELQGVGKAVRNLVILGPFITAAASAYSLYAIFNWPLTLAALFGAIICVSGPTVIVPLLRIVRPQQRIANILRWEGILIDPIGAILAVVTLGVIGTLHNSNSVSTIIIHTTATFLAAGVVSAITAFCLGNALRQHWVPEYLQNIATLSLVIAAYTVSNLVDEGSGLLCVTLMGVFITNMRNVPIEDILDFKENLSIMLISGIFIVIAAQVKFDSLPEVLMPSIMLFLALQFVARPLTVFLCTIKTDLNLKEKILLAWICPRGIVAAAVAPIFAIHLSELGINNAHQLVLITFLMIIGTVIFQSLTAAPLARLLNLAEPEPRGFLILGANPVARLLARALESHNYRTILVDSSWSNISKAKMEHLNTFYGNAVSEHADRHLDLIGIGNIITATPLANLNSLAILRYQTEFGRAHVFSLQTEQLTEATGKHIIAEQLKGTQLFQSGLTFHRLSTLIEAGAMIKSTQLTDNFNYQDFLTKNKNTTLPLFAIDLKTQVHFFTTDAQPELKSGWHIISLNLPLENNHEKQPD